MNRFIMIVAVTLAGCIQSDPELSRPSLSPQNPTEYRVAILQLESNDELLAKMPDSSKRTAMMEEQESMRTELESTYWKIRHANAAAAFKGVLIDGDFNTFIIRNFPDLARHEGLIP